ncbi:MAG: hypothetical protein MI794_12080 [Pseudomonadales bacterium]|nr:hypothetical protein [Pseudomonadales bacterium]
MNWMEFTLALLQQLVWPVSIIICLVLLRRPVSRLIPMAKRFRFQGMEVEFHQELKAASRNAQAAFPELLADRRCLLLSSVEHLPNTSILEAWRAVDEAAETLVRRHRPGVDLSSDTRYKDIETLLIAEDLVDTKKAKLFSELRQLRNKVAHARSFEVGKAEAMKYIELCFRLVEYLEQRARGTDATRRNPEASSA